MSVLNRIDSSADIKALSEEELKTLADEMRVFLVESVSKTGGHLASNLGAVELTLALHRVYDTAVDRIVFDVGHQSYVHKIITGRRDRFGTLVKPMTMPSSPAMPPTRSRSRWGWQRRGPCAASIMMLPAFSETGR